MPKEPTLSTTRVAVTYGVTSWLLAAAWYAKFPHGLWIVNAIAGSVGIALAAFTLGAQLGRIWGWSLGNALRGIALGILMVGVTQGSARLLLPRVPMLFAETQRLYGILNGPNGSERFLPIIAIVVIAEELVFRCVVTSRCATHLRPPAAVAVSAALYAIPLAASGSWLLMAIGLAVGAIWTTAWLSSRSLIVSLLAHAMWSCSTFVAFPLI